MLEMVQAGLADRVKEERHDLFSNLLAANDEDVEVNLSISEIVGEIFTLFPPSSQNLTYTDSTGNVFIYQLAGHETTAHTLAFAFAMLALYPDEQEKLYKHVKSVLPVDRPPVRMQCYKLLRCRLNLIHQTYEEIPLFTYSMA
jgi:cytochrome P450